MSREQRAYRRESRERSSLSAPSLKPFLFFGEAGPRLRFCEQEAFQLGRRRFLGKLHTACGLLVGFLGAHPPLPVLHSLRVPAWARQPRGKFARALATAPVRADDSLTLSTNAGGMAVP